MAHGYGKTDIVKGNWYYDLRKRFTDMGVAFVIWDKPGCGKSEGQFDINQSVQSSADELVAATREIRKRKVPGYERIGIWGISRGGWIAPLAIRQDGNIAFWISVSGPDDQENFKYLLEKNFVIEGHSETEAKALVNEWQTAFDIMRKGGSYADYVKANENLRKNDFYQYLGGSSSPMSNRGFRAEQKKYLSGEYQVNEESGLFIYVPDFSELLSQINIPVLAMFGELDTNVDWRKTKTLYENTIGKNPEAELIINVFPGGNHTLKKSITGGVRELINSGNAPYVDGYYETMEMWMQQVLEAG